MLSLLLPFSITIPLPFSLSPSVFLTSFPTCSLITDTLSTRHVSNRLASLVYLNASQLHKVCVGVWKFCLPIIVYQKNRLHHWTFSIACTVSKGHWRIVCFSFFSGYVSKRVLDKAEYSDFESTLNSPIVSYRIAGVVLCTHCSDLKITQRMTLLLLADIVFDRRCHFCYFCQAVTVRINLLNASSVWTHSLCSITPTCPGSDLLSHYYRLTLWRPHLPYGYSYKASCARPG